MSSGLYSSLRLPTALAERIDCTPSDFIPKMLARKFSSDGPMRCPAPCRARNATRRPRSVASPYRPRRLAKRRGDMHLRAIRQFGHVVEAAAADDPDLCLHSLPLPRTHDQRQPRRRDDTSAAKRTATAGLVSSRFVASRLWSTRRARRATSRFHPGYGPRPFRGRARTVSDSPAPPPRGRNARLKASVSIGYRS